MGITFTEASGLNNSIFGKSQAPIQMFLEKRGEQFEQTSVLKDLFLMGKSTHYAEKITSMTAMNGFEAVGENGAYPLDEMQEGYDKILENMTWKDSFSISREMIEDAIMMDMKKRPAAFISGYYRTREKFGAALFAGSLNQANTVKFGAKSFSTLGADGKIMFAKDHPSKLGKGTQSNLYDGAFTAENLSKVETNMQLFKGDNGEILDVSPDTILIPNLAAAKKTVFEVIGADKDPATSNNAFNYHFGRWNVICWPYLNQYLKSGLSTTFPWILMDSRYNQENGGAVWYDRTDLEVRSTLDENTDANVWRGYARFIAGFNDWRFACACGVTNGSTL